MKFKKTTDMEENSNTLTCPNDCLRCHEQQRIFCAAQMSRNAISLLNDLVADVNALKDEIASLRPSTESVMNPTIVTAVEDADKGLSQDNNFN